MACNLLPPNILPKHLYWSVSTLGNGEPITWRPVFRCLPRKVVLILRHIVPTTFRISAHYYSSSKGDFRKEGGNATETDDYISIFEGKCMMIMTSDQTPIAERGWKGLPLNEKQGRNQLCLQFSFSAKPSAGLEWNIPPPAIMMSNSCSSSSASPSRCPTCLRSAISLERFLKTRNRSERPKAVTRDSTFPFDLAILNAETMNLWRRARFSDMDSEANVSWEVVEW